MNDKFRQIGRRRALALLGAGAAGGATRAWPQGFAGMGGDAEGFALPAPDPHFDFPADHGTHPAYRIEWWYLTANLETASGAPCGIQWTLFRSALAPEEGPLWSSPQIWFAHAAMTRADRHVAAERFARGGVGQAGVTAAPYEAWIDDWAMVGRAGPGADALSAADLSARGPDFGYALRLDADGPLAFHGEDGFSIKHERGQASYYYSQPHYRVAGRLDWPDGPVEVTGRAWLDREWSSQPLDADQTGWDWFSLHLDGGAKVMLFRVRERAGDGFYSGTWIAPGGATEAIPDGAITVTPQAVSDVNGAPVPTTWRVEVPSRGLDLTAEALNPQAWMPLTVAYWEGPVRLSGSHGGVGYLEMTGYDA